MEGRNVQPLSWETVFLISKMKILQYIKIDAWDLSRKRYGSHHGLKYLTFTMSTGLCLVKLCFSDTQKGLDSA